MSGTLKKYQSVIFDQIANQTIDMRTTSKLVLDLNGKNIADKAIKVSSSNASISATYENQKITITNTKNDNIKTTIKVWDQNDADDAMEFIVSIVPKPELITKMNSEYGWYLDDEKTEEISTKNFGNNKNDKFEIEAQLQNVAADLKVSDYADVYLKQDAENNQKWYLHYKFKQAIPENETLQVGLKLNGEIISQFKLVVKAKTDISSNIESALDNIKNKYSWKTSQLNDLKTQVKIDINNIEGVDSYMFNWIDEGANLKYKI